MMTIDDLPPKLVGQLRRVILRIVQRESPITRTQLSVQVRPRSENWDIVLDDLVDRGLIHREAIIKDNGRAAVSYKYVDLGETDGFPGQFDQMSPEEVDEYVIGISEQGTSDTAAASA
jgi:predicted ArsR family transcriptional regulator